jgi:hypothetical protein
MEQSNQIESELICLIRGEINMHRLRALASGLIGAGALTAIHETARCRLPQAPRMDVLGMRAIAQSLLHFGQEPPAGEHLHQTALVGDLVANSLYYSLVGVGKPAGAPIRGLLLGLAAGIGALVLPGPLGLGNAPSTRTQSTAAMTLGWYVAGGLMAGLAYRWLAAERINYAGARAGRTSQQHLPM